MRRRFGLRCRPDSIITRHKRRSVLRIGRVGLRDLNLLIPRDFRPFACTRLILSFEASPLLLLGVVL